MSIHAYSDSAARDLGSKVSVLDPLARDARQSLREQAAAIEAMAARLEDGAFGAAVRLLSSVEGHVIITGIGKSGLVGQKMAATFASTGTPSFFLHAAEAFHGDLGMVTDHDAVVLISYSGETEEVVRLLPHLQARGVRTVGLVGDRDSTLAQETDVSLDVAVEREVCPNNLAPTSSTLATLAMGDALAISLIRMRGFQAEDFARLHPGGSLGRRLLGKVRDSMSRGPLPVVSKDGTASDCVFALAKSPVPVVLVMDGDHLAGAVTEAELRAALSSERGLETPVSDMMNAEPPILDLDTPLREAEAWLRRNDAPMAVVVDGDGQVCGILTQ